MQNHFCRSLCSYNSASWTALLPPLMLTDNCSWPKSLQRLSRQRCTSTILLKVLKDGAHMSCCLCPLQQYKAASTMSASRKDALRLWNLLRFTLQPRITCQLGTCYASAVLGILSMKCCSMQWPAEHGSKPYSGSLGHVEIYMSVQGWLFQQWHVLPLCLQGAPLRRSLAA